MIKIGNTYSSRQINRALLLDRERDMFIFQKKDKQENLTVPFQKETENSQDETINYS